jgi:hypothetical protein
VSSRITSKKVHPVRGSPILVAHLIPPKINATAQGERVFFDIDVKGGETNRGAFVAINAKGGDCWHVLQIIYACH